MFFLFLFFCIGLPFAKVFCGLFTRCIHEICLTDLGNFHLVCLIMLITSIHKDSAAVHHFVMLTLQQFICLSHAPFSLHPWAPLTFTHTFTGIVSIIGWRVPRKNIWRKSCKWIKLCKCWFILTSSQSRQAYAGKHSLMKPTGSFQAHLKVTLKSNCKVPTSDTLLISHWLSSQSKSNTH